LINSDRSHSAEDSLRLHSAGVMTACYGCGIFISVGEIFRSESKYQVTNFLMYIFSVIGHNAKAICYDDMCHLSSFVRNQIFKEKKTNPHLQFIHSLKQFIDRFHFPNHVDPHCRKHFNPDNKALQGINTQACEQENKFLKRFQHSVRYMNEARFIFFVLFMAHEHNVRYAVHCKRGRRATHRATHKSHK
jgi:hypothetical protein